MLTEEQIRSTAATFSTYARGCQYCHDGRVKGLRFFTDNHAFEAQVIGQTLYDVCIKLDAAGEIEFYDCTCPASYNYEGACKHTIAVLKSIQNQDLAGRKQTRQLASATQELLTFFQQKTAPPSESVPQSPIKLQPTYAVSIDQFGHCISWLEFTIGCERLYVLKDIPKFLMALANNEPLVYGKKFTLNPKTAQFDDASQPLLNLLKQAYAEEQQRANWSYYSNSYSAFNDPRQFKLTDYNLSRFFDCVMSRPFTALINGSPANDITILKERPPVTFSVNKLEDALELALKAEEPLLGLNEDYTFLYYKQHIYQVEPDFSSYMKPLLTCFRKVGKPSVPIPPTALSEFVSTMLPSLEEQVPVQVDNAVYENFYKQTLEKRVYLDRFGDGISAQIEFRYGEVVINPAQPSQNTEIKGQWLLRSLVEENELLTLFFQHQFAWNHEKLQQPDEETTYDFLQQTLPDVQALAEVFYTDAFKQIVLKQPPKITAGVKLNTDTDMLEFSFDYNETSPRELLELLASYKLKKRYHRLPDGTFIPLDSPDLQMAATLVHELDLSTTDVEKGIIELPKYRALYVDSLARENADFSLERSKSFKQMVQDIREPQDMELNLPQGIQGKLRDYQKTGFKWLKTLASYGLGGILADDMGLGKTLQVLTFILSEKQQSPLPSLVIAPTSLVYNWQDEVLKFAPTLKLAVISGQPDERKKQLKASGLADLLVTSYALIKRDIKFYEKRQFKYCFLDEAQHVKNPQTLSAKSVKKIKANSYFALTGTPIENSLTELWSIFDFVMPGYLRTHKNFTSRYEIPIIKNSDSQALTELTRHIHPFILRRMKKTVLKELPDKIESKMTNEMTKEQTKLYGAWILKAQTAFESEVATYGFEKSQIKILSLLTRLRQLCCHPALFIEDYHGGCGKLDMLKEILTDALSSGHRILLFSQFTGMLNLIQQELEEMQISYHYLDGSTKSEERIKLVHSFNSGEKQMFLISLKAGGTGLNLTGADMVIHYDPWWNPAVEEQATDRAYRIGQQKAVQVYKLITKNTIEEKIYALQQKKREMIDSLIHPGETFLTKMNEAEIRELFTF
ncbi:SNF2 family DNA or RNA helicase [Sporomusaceae bacterium BoRhaA]|uniref:DEAD/DEAH box helicase n=1 Tax=Pelorhabdus rhamnosifermentans TaxID=2772457 RepID=UPI001C06177A|nr:DEAD/DEAH box helicase [Pelorhabdus rhamnosifermentans]MBU2700545.1 SNF2 family DNA or RNA helicase [Pelorhabdus rhamnosifermentans]